VEAQLDILAIEPFYGGQRKWILDTLVATSRHRWRTMTLPARRIQRRVATSAVWFAEQYHRHPVDKVDLLFTTDALNLAEFLRLVPELTNVPSVVYFQDNELNAPTDDDLTGTTANLASATAAGRFYFNSTFHQQMFLARLDVLARTQPDLAGNIPSIDLIHRTSVLAPPLNLAPLEAATASAGRRVRRRIMVDTHDADLELLNEGLTYLARAGQIFELVCYGPSAELPAEFVVKKIPEGDLAAVSAALCEVGLYVSTHRAALCDLVPLLALKAGAGVIVPAEGFFRDALPEELHGWNLYQPVPSRLCDRIVDHLTLGGPPDFGQLVARALRPHEVVRSVAAFDAAIEQTLGSHVPRTARRVERVAAVTEPSPEPHP
jgi:hypothetical protein